MPRPDEDIPDEQWWREHQQERAKLDRQLAALLDWQEVRREFSKENAYLHYPLIRSPFPQIQYVLSGEWYRLHKQQRQERLKYAQWRQRLDEQAEGRRRYQSQRDRTRGRGQQAHTARLPSQSGDSRAAPPGSASSARPEAEVAGSAPLYRALDRQSFVADARAAAEWVRRNSADTTTTGARASLTSDPVNASRYLPPESRSQGVQRTPARSDSAAPRAIPSVEPRARRSR